MKARYIKHSNLKRFREKILHKGEIYHNTSERGARGILKHGFIHSFNYFAADPTLWERGVQLMVDPTSFIERLYPDPEQLTPMMPKDFWGLRVPGREVSAKSIIDKIGMESFEDWIEDAISPENLERVWGKNFAEGYFNNELDVVIWIVVLGTISADSIIGEMDE